MNTRKTFHHLRLPLVAALLAVFLAARPAAAADRPAPKRVHWSGRGIATDARFTFDHAGRYWTMMMTSERVSIDATGTEAMRSDDFIELKFPHARLRLCKDKLLTLSKSGDWIEIAEGKWGRPLPNAIPAPKMIPRDPEQPQLIPPPGDLIPIPTPKADSPLPEDLNSAPKPVPRPLGQPQLVPSGDLIPAPGSIRPVDEREYWSGRSTVTDSTYSYTYGKGRRWTMTLLTGKGETISGPMTEVARCKDFIELELNGSPLTHDRLCKDKLLTLSKSGRWSELAEGKWGEPPIPMPAPKMMPLPPGPEPELPPGDPIPAPKAPKNITK